MSSVEPEIMTTAKQLIDKFVSFFIRNLYFVFALFFLNFVYKYLIFKYIPFGPAQAIILQLFELSFYPVMMIFAMYIVNAFYAGKKVRNLNDLMEQGRLYFRPILYYYLVITAIKFVIPSQLLIIAFVIMVKLAFVDQLIYYRDYNFIEAIKVSFKMVSMRLFFLFFIAGILLYSIMISIINYATSSGVAVNEIYLGVQLFTLTLVRFFITISYRELIKHNFYRALSS